MVEMFLQYFSINIFIISINENNKKYYKQLMAHDQRISAPLASVYHMAETV